MKKNTDIPQRISTPAELHQLLGLSGTRHPMVSIFDNSEMRIKKRELPRVFLLDFYNISLKKKLKGRTGYGQSYYDFDDSTMVFTAPGQLISTEEDTEYYGLSLLFHPDFIRTYPLGKRIKQFGFFSYETNEALHLSEREKTTILTVFKNIEDELLNNIDDFSQDIIISQIESLLNYCNRFYNRQFITRKVVHHDLLVTIESLLEEFFKDEMGLNKGLPTVEYLSRRINVSPRYLSDMLRSIIGQNAQNYIHEKLIEKAKEYLSASSMSIAEIAYLLGFEYPQSFSKLFKKKTKLTPVEFKHLFSSN